DLQGQRAPAPHVCSPGRRRAAGPDAPGHGAAGTVLAATTRKSVMSDDCARTIGRLAAGVAVSLLLGACASMAPEYQRPAPPVSPAFPEAPPATADGGLAADIQWQDFFAD